MYRAVQILGTAFLFVLAAIAPSAEAPPLSPGSIRMKGGMNEFSQFLIDIEVRQGTPQPFTILAVKVYSEPSGTFLLSQVDASAPASLLQAVLLEKPYALSTEPIGSGLGHYSMPPPPESDHGIRVDYVLKQGQDTAALTISDGNFKTAREFEFTSEPAGGGGIQHCGYCGGSLCGCVTCTGPWTLCCPSCTIVCGIYTCPP